MENIKMNLILDEDLSNETDLQKMKAIAGSLLILAFLVFTVASVFKERALWVGFVQATAEAAMVGALADWFAVTALFRHPLNLKIPHTAIIPNRKDMIGEQLGRFVKINFLTGEIITEKLSAMDAARTLAGWIIHPANSALIARHVALGLATIVQVMNNEDIQILIEHNVARRVRSTQIAPLLGKFLSFVTSGGREKELVQGTVKLGVRLLAENKDPILTKISRETPWWLPHNVDQAIYQKIADSLEETLQAVNADPEHPLFEHFNDLINRFVEDLKHSPEVLTKEAAWKEDLLQESVVQEFSASLWLDIKGSLMERGADPDLELRRSIQQGLVSFGEAILNDPELLEKINRWLEGATLYLIEQYGYEVEHLISQTIHRWDAKATSRKIELQVGKDLQFIRINGTIVGGLAGFVIHAISLLFIGI